MTKLTDKERRAYDLASIRSWVDKTLRPLTIEQREVLRCNLPTAWVTFDSSCRSPEITRLESYRPHGT